MPLTIERIAPEGVAQLGGVQRAPPAPRVNPRSR